MTKRQKLAWLSLALLILACIVSSSAEVVDRTIAVVNKHLVTWSDLDEQMRFEALENGRPLSDLNEADRRAAFEHLVQDRMLRDQMQGTAPATPADIQKRIAEVRIAWQVEKDGATWAVTLHHYGLSAQELSTLVANQLEVLRFMEFQVRPLVRVSRTEVEDYYNNTLAPKVMAAGQTPEPLEQVQAKIRELLMEQKTNSEMEKWLENLKTQSRVQVLWDGVR
jgi:hypothetical protein